MKFYWNFIEKNWMQNSSSHRWKMNCDALRILPISRSYKKMNCDALRILTISRSYKKISHEIKQTFRELQQTFPDNANVVFVLSLLQEQKTTLSKLHDVVCNIFTFLSLKAGRHYLNFSCRCLQEHITNSHPLNTVFNWFPPTGTKVAKKVAQCLVAVRIRY